MEGKRPNIDRWPQDPRTMLADRLRDLFMSALHQQEAAQEPATGSHGVRAGSLFKIDGGFMKIRLEAPASDVVFSADKREIRGRDGLGTIWALIPVTRGQDLEEAVFNAENITVHTSEGDEEEGSQFMCRDDFLGPLIPVVSTLDELLGYEPPKDAEQIESAKVWFDRLDQYDLRSIVGSSQGGPDDQSDVAC